MMKKWIFIILFAFLLIGCNEVEQPIDDDLQEQTVDELLESIIFDREITQLDLPESFVINNQTVYPIWESSDESIITNEGEVNRGIYDQEVTLTLSIFYRSDIGTKDFDFIVLGIGEEAFLEEALSSRIPSQTEHNLFLPETFRYTTEWIDVTWQSSNLEIISDDGKVGLIADDTDIVLTATATYKSTTITREYTITILAMSVDSQAQYVFNTLSLNSAITESFTLPNEFEFDITGSWESSHPTVISPQGVVNPLPEPTKVTLTLTLNTEHKRTYELTVIANNHLIFDRTFAGSKEDVVLDDAGKLVLAEGKTFGTYESQVYNTLPFYDIIPSWAAVSSKDATCEMLIRVRIGSVWSSYISYGEWGLERQNHRPLNPLPISGNTVANALQMKVILRRTTQETPSPEVSLLTSALGIHNYRYNVDISDLPTEFDHDVPMLRQTDVPGIGNIICSPTSAAMLLMYRGHDFTDKDVYPHRYIAEVVRDYNTGIYGSWYFNTVGMGAFGEDTYVQRMYSYQELIHHLYTVGPISASVRGTMIGEIGRTWTTNGHLIVIRGYRWEGEQLYILANDPFMHGIYEEYKVENFLNVWRYIAYVIE